MKNCASDGWVHGLTVINGINTARYRVQHAANLTEQSGNFPVALATWKKEVSDTACDRFRRVFNESKSPQMFEVGLDVWALAITHHLPSFAGMSSFDGAPSAAMKSRTVSTPGFFVSPERIFQSVVKGTFVLTAKLRT